MIDQELLLAAKAAGATEYMGCDDCSPPGLKIYNGRVLHYEGHGEFGYAWDPCNNDGDSRQLQVACMLGTGFAPGGSAWAAPSFGVSRATYVDYKGREAEAAAAMRMAVFRAAVEIGRTMP